MCVRYMLMGGAVDLWMLYVGRFLTGVAGGMTAASIPVGYHGYRNFLTYLCKFSSVFVSFTSFLITVLTKICKCLCLYYLH